MNWRQHLATLAILLPGMVQAAVSINDAVGEHRFERLPERVVALTWEGAENLLALGVTPLAVADADDYREWVVQPALPTTVPSAGTRLEPHLEWLLALDPDLILISPVLHALRPRLEAIAPVLEFDAFGHDQNNADTARRIFLDLAHLLDREDQARARLAQVQETINRWQERLHDHCPDALPAVEVVRFDGPGVTYVYGANSMPIHALQALGFDTTDRQASSRWGVTQLPMTDLATFDQAHVLYQEPFEQADTLFATPLWQAMPFVRSGRFGAVPAVWSYGGVASLGYLAEALASTLLTLPCTDRVRPWTGAAQTPETR